MANRTATLYIRITTSDGRKSYCTPVFQSKGRLKPQHANASPALPCPGPRHPLWDILISRSLSLRRGSAVCGGKYQRLQRFHNESWGWPRAIASLRAIATLAIFLPRLIVKWTYLLRHSGRLRAVTWAASTSKKRNIELPCFVIWPSRRRFPLESSKGTNPKYAAICFPH
jgi:hypothetical protein